MTGMLAILSHRKNLLCRTGVKGLTDEGSGTLMITLTICDQHTCWSSVRTLVKSWADQLFCELTEKWLLVEKRSYFLKWLLWGTFWLHFWCFSMGTFVFKVSQIHLLQMSGVKHLLTDSSEHQIFVRNGFKSPCGCDYSPMCSVFAITY